MVDISKVEDALFSIEDTISTSEALQILNYTVSRVTLIEWCRLYGIGGKMGGRWRVHPDKLALLLKGNLKAKRRV